MKNLHVALILDKSGSMDKLKKTAIDSFNELIQEYSDQCDENLQVYMYIVTFNGSVFEVAWKVKPQDIELINEQNYKPSGATAMFDAFGYTVSKLFDECSSNEDNYLIMTISDGETNQDKNYGVSSIKEIVQSCKDKNWTVSFIGCSKNYMDKLSEDIKLSKSNMASCDYSKPESLTKAMYNIRNKCKSYVDKLKTNPSMCCVENFVSNDEKIIDLSVENLDNNVKFTNNQIK